MGAKGRGSKEIRTPRMIRNKKKMLAMLWNWNHRFFGTNERGVYFAVRILFRGYSLMGWPSSSMSSGSGRLK